MIFRSYLDKVTSNAVEIKHIRGFSMKTKNGTGSRTRKRGTSGGSSEANVSMEVTVSREK